MDSGDGSCKIRRMLLDNGPVPARFCACPKSVTQFNMETGRQSHGDSPIQVSRDGGGM